MNRDYHPYLTHGYLTRSPVNNCFRCGVRLGNIVPGGQWVDGTTGCLTKTGGYGYRFFDHLFLAEQYHQAFLRVRKMLDLRNMIENFTYVIHFRCEFYQLPGYPHVNTSSLRHCRRVLGSEDGTHTITMRGITMR